MSQRFSFWDSVVHPVDVHILQHIQDLRDLNHQVESEFRPIECILKYNSYEISFRLLPLEFFILGDIPVKQDA